MTAPTITTTRMMTDAMRTGLSIRSANEGFHRRTSIPSTTGSSTIAKTSTAFTNWMPSSPEPGMKNAIERFTMSGRVSTAMTEFMGISLW